MLGFDNENETIYFAKTRTFNTTQQSFFNQEATS